MAQNCEVLDRQLFHALPKEIPKKINCLDSLGNKQGWWVDYSKKHNAIAQPDFLDTGIYVERYSYGLFKNNKKIGTWKLVNNVHLIYEEQESIYIYNNQSSTVHTRFLGENRDVIMNYNNDSTIIKAYSIFNKERDTICFACFKLKDRCTISYKKQYIKTTPFKNLDFELEKSYNELQNRVLRKTDHN
jgi:hypothetical protein